MLKSILSCSFDAVCKDFFLSYCGQQIKNFPVDRKSPLQGYFPTPKTEKTQQLAKNVQLLYDAQFGKVEHDLFLTIVLELNRCDRAMSGSLDAENFSESKFLMFYFLAWL